MTNFFSNLANGLGDAAAGSNYLTSGTSDFLNRFGTAMLNPAGLTAQDEAKKKAEALAQLAPILSGQSIAAYARPGGAEPQTPEETQQQQLAQLSNLGTPEATAILSNLSPLSVKPLTNLERLKAEADIAETRAKTKYYGSGGGATAGGGATGQLAMMIKTAYAQRGEPIDDAQAIYLAQTGMRQGQQMDSAGGVAPIAGAITAKADLKTGEKAAEEAAITAAIAPRELETKRSAAYVGALEAAPLLKTLSDLNEGTIDAPYADAFQPALKMSGSEKATKLDLMKQARLELAAPLAKQLGVNPTDKDFQASLDRIFDIKSSKPSRAAQIQALTARVMSKPNLYSTKPAEYIPVGGNINAPVTKIIGRKTYVQQNGKWFEQ